MYSQVYDTSFMKCKMANHECNVKAGNNIARGAY